MSGGATTGAGWLARWRGDLVWHAARRRRALEQLATAFPQASTAERERWARESFHHRAAAARATRRATRCGVVELCRRLTLEGWEHAAAAGEGKGVVFLLPALGSPAVAARVLDLWAGPLHRVGAGARRPAGAEERAREVLAGGGRVGVFLPGRAGGAGDEIEAVFLGRAARPDAFPARLAHQAGAPLLAAFALPEPAGRWRFLARPVSPPPAERGPEQIEAAVALTAAYLRVVEEEIRRHPELWGWGG